MIFRWEPPQTARADHLRLTEREFAATAGARQVRLAERVKRKLREGIGAASGGEEAQDGRLEKRGIHAEFERQRPAQPAANGVDQVPQEGRGGS
jgi:hypothetical protein